MIRIANRGGKPVTIAERELAPTGTVAVSLGKTTLGPCEATQAFIVTSTGRLE